ncbi:metallophosphoesterase [Azospirillum sp. SYSU D00513]|uniref:metallophosphoesterase family protein n=1 Tax=Azospirillum sp. SYSU D00513 TaxID=2812561 RepID=UPI001A964EDF|nr:metallophosphoesterase [Azospirillum sp. SYSU D00513]
MRPAYRFAHFSDPHLPLPDGWPAPLRHLAGKRLLGFASWRRKRHQIHRPEVLAALVEDVARHAPDHLAVTGDLVNIALPEEFVLARAWLEGLGAPDHVTVVPGNHDATVVVPESRGIGLWRPWMTGDAAGNGGGDAEEGTVAFPFVRRRGPVAFVGVSTAVPSLPLLAIGTVGPAQLERLEATLTELGREGLFRVVLMHHAPLIVRGNARKALTDRKRVQALLARTGAELVLHGHYHQGNLCHLPGPGGRAIPVVGVASASATPILGLPPAQWAQFTVTEQPGGGWRLSALIRSYADGAFRDESRFAVGYDEAGS